MYGTFFVDCGNRALDIILYMARAKASEAGITLDIKAAPPHTLPFSDLDLCKLYMNVIDNAIEACVSEKAEDPTIRILIGATDGYLFTRITNPTRKTPDMFAAGEMTTKADRKAHGKGRAIIRGIVRKYGGRMNSRIENGNFICEFLLALEQAETGAPEEQRQEKQHAEQNSDRHL